MSYYRWIWTIVSKAYHTRRETFSKVFNISFLIITECYKQKGFNMNFSTITECYKRDPSLRNSTRCSILRNSNLKLKRALANENFQCQDLKGVKLVATSRLGLSCLCDHNFKHAPICFSLIWNFMDICFDRETISHLFSNVPCSILNNGLSWTFSMKLSESFLTCALLYGNEPFEDEINSLIWNATTDFILLTKRIVEQLTSSSLILFLIITVLRPPTIFIALEDCYFCVYCPKYNQPTHMLKMLIGGILFAWKNSVTLTKFYAYHQSLITSKDPAIQIGKHLTIKVGQQLTAKCISHRSL